MTALQAVAARHSSFHTTSVSAGLFVGITSAYRKVASKVMATTEPRRENGASRAASQANGLMREHNSICPTTL